MIDLRTDELVDSPWLEETARERYSEPFDLRRTKVTAASIAELNQSLPNCKINWDDAEK